jgi:hypothetical protein
MCVSYTPSSEDSAYGVLDNNFQVQDGDQVFFLAPGENVEIVLQDESDEEDDSDYEEESDDEDDDEEDEDDEEDNEGVNNEEEELHQFYRSEAQAMEDEGLYDDIPELVSDSDSVSDTEILSEEEERGEGVPLSPPVLRRETTSDYLTPIRENQVSTPSAPRGRRVLGDLTNVTIRPRRLHFN